MKIIFTYQTASWFSIELTLNMGKINTIFKSLVVSLVLFFLADLALLEATHLSVYVLTQCIKDCCTQTCMTTSLLQYFILGHGINAAIYHGRYCDKKTKTCARILES